MACIRHIKIENFRSIKKMEWCPNPQFNCLIGHGDSGKSTILNAIDFCIGNKRNIQFGDDDFYRLNIKEPIIIEVTLGDLDDNLKNLDSYGLYLRGFFDLAGMINDEPEKNDEIVITIQLKIDSSLEPIWSLVSDRAIQQGITRMLSWTDRAKICASRIGHFAMNDLAWSKGSVLHKLSDEKVETSAFTDIARDARKAFGTNANDKLSKTRKIVIATAKNLGVNIGTDVKALLDHDSVSFGGAKVSLHNSNDVPLKNLGIGSSRLLVAGLQKEAAVDSEIIVMDEIEYGLEPHRLIRLMGSLGAKDKKSRLQVFVTTHSPVAIKELAGEQLWVIRNTSEEVKIDFVGCNDDIQSTLRKNPEAFLAPTVLVCEGATEVGFIRGMDLERAEKGLASINANGVALVDAGGVNNIVERASVFQELGYRVAIFRDDDVQPDSGELDIFIERGGKDFFWPENNSIETELFSNLSDLAVQKLIEKAKMFHGNEIINNNIMTASDNKFNLASVQSTMTPQLRIALAKASQYRNSGWFKSVSFMEEVAYEVIAKDSKAKKEFKSTVTEIFNWFDNDQARI